MDPTTTTAPCRFFATPRGCLRGESCTFRHEPARASPSQQQQQQQQMHMPQSQQHPSPPMYPLDPQDGRFGQGPAMTFSPGNPYAHHLPGPPPCRFFLTEAGCRNGHACTYAHLGGGADGGDGMGGLGNGAMDDPSGGAGDPRYAALSPPLPPPLPLADADLGMLGYGGATAYGTQTPLPPPPLPPPQLEPPSPNGSTPSTTPTAAGNGHKPRRKLHIQANPSKKANYEVISEISPVLTREITGPFYAIDVECVATGTGPDDRDVARIAVVDDDEEVIFDEYVLPDKPIVSYLTQLTGISECNLVGAPSLAEALVQLRRVLPTDGVIVGQSIKKDLEWLGLVKDTDYKQMFDVADLFRIPMQSKNGMIRYRYFSLRHVAKYLLGHDIQEADHDPVIDAKYAMKVFKQFRHLHESPGRRDAVYQTLLQTPRTPSFADRFPVIDGVLMRIPRKPREPYPNQRGPDGAYNDTSAVPPT